MMTRQIQPLHPAPSSRVPLANPTSPSETHFAREAPPVPQRNFSRAESSARRGSSHAGSVHSGNEGSVYALRMDSDPGPSRIDLESFGQHCRQFYFSNVNASSRQITAKLNSLPPSHRAVYTRLQSAIRAEAHVHQLRIRISSFHAFLAGIQVSASLPPQARSDLQGQAARAERKVLFRRFLEKWCTLGNVGTEPFFKALRAICALQGRSINMGGAEANRVVWELDDAVFQESSGPDFMREALTTLKGVLGFSDQPLAPGPLSPENVEDVETLSNAKDFSTMDAPQRPLLPRRSTSEVQRAAHDAEVDLNKPRYRLWIFPAHIDDQEIDAILRLFPAFTKRDVRFPYLRPGRGPEGESGGWTTVHIGDVIARVPLEECEVLEGVVRHGSGRMWIGTETRLPWRGNRWFRFVRWLRRLLGLA